MTHSNVLLFRDLNNYVVFKVRFGWMGETTKYRTVTVETVVRFPFETDSRHCLFHT